MDEILVNLAVAGPYRNLFTYKLRHPDELDLQPGCRFLVLFGGGVKVAFYVEPQTAPVAYRLRYVRERIDIGTPFPSDLFRFCRWMADYYFAGLGEVLAAALPGTGTKKPRLEYIVSDRAALERLIDNDARVGRLARRLLQRGSISDAALGHQPDLAPLVRRWTAEGIIVSRHKAVGGQKKLLGYRLSSDSEETTMSGAVRQLQPGVVYPAGELAAAFGLSAYRIAKLCKENIIEKVHGDASAAEMTDFRVRHELPKLELLEEQKRALDDLIPVITAHRFAPFLLFGITGSGKTLVYCHAARETLAAGRSVLVMVPEIALSGLLLSSFAAFFGDRVAVIHSGLTAVQRMFVREKIASGEVRVVIGPRSALFSPMKDLGLIVVDEEHDPSYKQDDPAPRYHARDAAVMLGKTCSCPVILGSASPSVESYYNATTGRYRLLTLNRRPQSGYQMPQILTLDMKSEKISGECSFLSYRLKKETETHIASGGQVIYYLNRRGFAPRLKCQDCGEVPVCPDCGVTLAYHRSGNQLKCHFCDRVEPAPQKCDHCGGNDFIALGTGTQRVEENLARLFENIRAERIDSDKTARKSGRLILSEFAEDKFDLLVGTQMVTKGLDIPNVTLVGVLAADIGLEMPDFRAAEKTYARLLQVAGRAGRGDREGTVMIQTYYSDHPVIRHLAQGNYLGFFEMVLEERRELQYPPFSRLINITLTSEDEKLLEKEALTFRIRLEERLSGLSTSGTPPGAPPLGVGSGAPPLAVGLGGPSLRTGRAFVLLGPAPAPIYKLRGQYRRRLIIKCGSTGKIVARFRAWEDAEKGFGLPAKVKAIFDIDPVNMM
ncbi:MAG: primosomal protein N' [candidate division Zixibacteria bacterium]|nr:primosomal protein N' [candidate division Zixibacteria bacterium]